MRQVQKRSSDRERRIQARVRGVIARVMDDERSYVIADETRRVTRLVMRAIARELRPRARRAA